MTAECIANMTYDERMQIAECACDGCKGQAMLRYDGECYKTCDTFREAVEEEERNAT